MSSGRGLWVVNLAVPDVKTRMSLQTTKVEMDNVRTEEAKQTAQGTLGRREATQSRALRYVLLPF